MTPAGTSRRASRPVGAPAPDAKLDSGQATSPAVETGAGRINSTAVDDFARTYGFPDLPKDWVGWVRTIGGEADELTGWELLGLTAGTRGLSARTLTAGYRFTIPGFPHDLVPIEELPDGQLICLNAHRGDVVVIDVGDPTTFKEPNVVADSFTQYREGFLRDCEAMEDIAQFFTWRDGEVAANRRTRDQHGRPDDWKIYRLATQNVVLATALVRFNREEGWLEVGAAVVAQIAHLDEHAPARALMTTLLAECYRAGGDLSVRFVRGRRRGARSRKMPLPLQRWAAAHDLSVTDRFSSAAAAQLFPHALVIDPQLRTELIDADPREGTGLSFALASGAWSDVEAISILAGPEPGRVLGGLAGIHTPVELLADLQSACTAVMLDDLVRRASYIESSAGDSEDAGGGLVFHRDGAALLLDAPGTLASLASWSVGNEPGALEQATQATVCAVMGERDELAGAIRRGSDLGEGGRLHLIVAPQDLVPIDDPALVQAIQAARARGAVVLAMPDYASKLRLRATAKLHRAAGMRS